MPVGGAFPCVLAQVGDAYVRVLAPDDLRCRKSDDPVTALATTLRSALADVRGHPFCFICGEHHRPADINHLVAAPISCG
jgi:hypothetical protein